MIQDPVQLREALMTHSMKYPGTMKEIAARIGMRYPALRAFMKAHVRKLNFEHTCKINQYLATYTQESSGPLTVRQTCDLQNAIRFCKLGTQDTMHRLTDLMGLEDIQEIDASRFEEAMGHIQQLNLKV